MSHAYKKVAPQPKPEPTRYSPVELVKKHGDGWSYLVPIQCCGATSLALRDTTPDMCDAHLMSMMEQGRYPRVEE